MECGICGASAEFGYRRHVFHYDFDLCVLCRKISNDDQTILLREEVYKLHDKFVPEKRWVPDLVKKSREAKEKGIWNEFRGMLIYKNLIEKDDKYKY